MDYEIFEFDTDENIIYIQNTWTSDSGTWTFTIHYNNGIMIQCYGLDTSHIKKNQ
jgi:hypothetical protein